MNGKKSQNKTMNILIFGGAGFVGRHYAKYFLERGNLVEVIDNIAPLSGGIHPKKWKLFNPFKFKKVIFDWFSINFRIVPEQIMRKLSPYYFCLICHNIVILF